MHICIHITSISTFTTKLTHYLEQYPNFKDCFFYHKWRGMKGGTAHDGAIGQQIDNAFNTLSLTSCNSVGWIHQSMFFMIF
jgi:hypothetical protein